MGPGLDHGVFVPFRIMFGEDFTEIPIVQVSIDSSLDSTKNWELGKAVASLRYENPHASCNAAQSAPPSLLFSNLSPMVALFPFCPLDFQSSATEVLHPTDHQQSQAVCPAVPLTPPPSPKPGQNIGNIDSMTTDNECTAINPD